MKKLITVMAVVVLIALISIAAQATGAGISAKVFEPLPSYRAGDIITFEFGGIACDPGGADNFATFTAVLPDGSIEVREVLIPNGEGFLFFVDYIVRAEDVLEYEGTSYVRASLSMIGYDTDGGGFEFYAEASAAIDLSDGEVAAKSVKVKKDNPHRNVKSYK